MSCELSHHISTVISVIISVETLVVRIMSSYQCEQLCDIIHTTWVSYRINEPHIRIYINLDSKLTYTSLVY